MVAAPLPEARSVAQDRGLGGNGRIRALEDDGGDEKVVIRAHLSPMLTSESLGLRRSFRVASRLGRPISMDRRSFRDRLCY
jgi:hypothetical protein